MSVTVQTIIEKAYTKVNGEYEAVVESSDDFKTYLNVLNQVMEVWADTPYVKWQTLFNMNYTLPTPVADTVLTYAITDPTSLVLANTPFDSVYFIDGAGKVVDKYKMTDQAFFDATSDLRVASWIGGTLRLKATPAKILGTTIRLPVYTLPPIYTSAATPVVIDNTSWLVTYIAAFICDASPVPFIARNADKFYKQAEVFMKTMRDDNRKRQHLVVKQLGDSYPGMTWADVMSVMTMRDL